MGSSVLAPSTGALPGQASFSGRFSEGAVPSVVLLSWVPVNFNSEK